MRKIAATFPGKVGDILWSLPTVREISKLAGKPVDFYVMPHFDGVCELIESQPYINKCEGINGWEVDGNKALQDWEPPYLPDMYDAVYHLGYKSYPSYPLVLHAAMTANISWTQPVLPFIEAEPKGNYDVIFGFSVYVDPIVDDFIDKVVNKVMEKFPSLKWINGSQLPWKEFAEYTAGSKVYIGDKTGMHVIAHGLNKDFIIEAEGNSERRASTFCCPWNENNVFRIESFAHYQIIDLTTSYADAIIDYLEKNNA